MRTRPDSVKRSGSNPDPLASRSRVPGSRLTPRRRRLEKTGPHFVLASWRETIQAAACTDSEIHAAGSSTRHAATRQKPSAVDAHAWFHAHPPRWRVGTQPAPTLPLGDRQIPSSLRGIGGHPRKRWLGRDHEAQQSRKEFHAEAAGISFGTHEFVVAVAPERCPSARVETFPSFTADLGRRGSLRIAACRTWAALASGR